MASHGTDPLPTRPYSLELLADLHAGALPESVSAQLWPLVRQDPDAMDVLTALDAVTARLAAAGRGSAQGEPLPPEVAERIDRALAEAAHESGAEATNVVTLVSRKRGVRFAIVAGVAATVALGVVVTAIVVNSATSSDEGAQDLVADAPPADSPSLVVDSDSLDASVAYEVMANRETNDLLESGALPGCLAANGFDSSTSVLGSARVDLDGQRGVMLVLPKPDQETGLTLLAVDTDCGLGHPGVLVRRDID
ncbi:hypothetical protein [Rhodococcus sovatensis]|uniref:Anti-sigma-M factor RsmA n=1 Tax=Rhodococcus sovatensis TaxID=1805840 RepID=A0ABZ2PIV1_9NOCA